MRTKQMIDKIKNELNGNNTKYQGQIDLKLVEQIYDLMGIADENEIPLNEAKRMIVEYIDNIFEREQDLDDELKR